MFDTPQPYAAHLRVGVHAWDVASTDDPAFGPLAGVKFTWQARQDDGWPTQHEPTVLVFGVVVEAGTDFDDVDQGTVVHFTFTPDGYASPLVTFGGTVRDLTATPHDRGMVYTITAVDYLQSLKEDYVISATVHNGDPSSTLWPMLIGDAGGAGMGLGIRPALVDPFTGTDGPVGSGFAGADYTITEAPAWEVLTGYMGNFLDRAGATTPRFQRPILTYRLDGAGNLDAAQPYQARWTAQGHDNSPLSLVETSPGVWGAAGGNVDGCLLRTAGTVWMRQRVEPNRVVLDADLGPFIYTRPSTLDPANDVAAVEVTREMSGGWWEGNATDPLWVLAGLDNPDQWGSVFSLVGSYDPAVVAGWFTLPTAMRIMVAAYDIDARHTPTGSGRMRGLLAGATLLIGPRGIWDVGFTLRRTLPDYLDVYQHPIFGTQDYGIGQWPLPQAITFDDLAVDYPGVTFANLDPALTFRDAELIGD
jgi:hypothetical protein